MVILIRHSSFVIRNSKYELRGERLGARLAQGGSGGVEQADRAWVIIRLEEQAVGRTGAQALGVVAKTETDVETVVQ